MNKEDKEIRNQTLSHFDRYLGNLHGLPEVTSVKPSVLRVVPTFGIGTHMYCVQTFRMKEQGDTIFLEHVSDEGTTRIVLPPAVADAIARQRESLTGKSRSRAAQATAADRKARGLQPGFMKKKKK